MTDEVRVRAIQCAACGAAVLAQSPRQIRCAGCARGLKSLMQKEYTARYIEKLWVDKLKRRRRPCLECGAEFIAAGDDVRYKFCSSRCRNKANSRSEKGRARKRRRWARNKAKLNASRRLSAREREVNHKRSVMHAMTMSDQYVKKLVVKRTWMKQADVPQQFVEAYRELLKLKRQLNMGAK